MFDSLHNATLSSMCRQSVKRGNFMITLNPSSDGMSFTFVQLLFLCVGLKQHKETLTRVLT